MLSEGKRKQLILSVALAACVVACSTSPSPVSSQPVAAVETNPVPHKDDAADDPAIWIHPSAADLSLVLGTDKQGGLHVYNLDGSENTFLGGGSKPNNVDVIYGIQLGSNVVDLVLASTRAERSRGIRLWAIDPPSRKFRDVTSGAALPVFGGAEPYGCCGYRSADGHAKIFVSSKDGLVEQYVVRPSTDGDVELHRIAKLNFESTIEGCVVDETTGFVYFGEESRGIWKLPAEPGKGRKPLLIARVGENGLSVDVEGLAIYHGPGESGYLLASSQGNNTFKVYARDGNNEFVGTIDPASGAYGDVEDTDGVAVTSASLGRYFPNGLFVAQDGKNGRANQNFKFYRWEDVAGTNLLISPTWNPRSPSAR